MSNPKPELRPPDYQEHDGCHNCVHVFKEFDYESGPNLFCHLDGSSRPPCTNPKMKELNGFLSTEQLNPIYDAWWDWSEPREVVAWGKCSCHERGVEK